jgi:uncharacterized membrane protein YkoI
MSADNCLLTDVSELSGGPCQSGRRKEFGPAMRLSLKIGASLLLLPAFAACISGGRADSRRDHDVARQAVERGEIKPLVEILQGVRDQLPGEITKVEIEREGARLLYELQIVDPRGRLFEVHVDAATGKIDRSREK